MQNPYVLTVPSALQASLLSVFDFSLTEALDRPYRLNIGATSPDAGLSLARFIDQPVSFRMRPAPQAPELAQPEPAARVWHGVIRQAWRERSNREETLYRFEVAPRLDRLADFTSSRLFQQQTAPQIVEALLRRHGFTGADFVFRGTREYVRREFTTQYQESDLAFATRLLADEGIWFSFAQGEHHEQIVFGDNLEHYGRTLARAPLSEHAGLESAAHGAIDQLHLHHQTMRQRTFSQDYNYRDAGNPLRAQAGFGGETPAALGEDQRWGEHHKTDAEADTVARLRQQLSVSRQCRARGSGTLLALSPGEVLRLEQAFADAPHGWLVSEVTHQGSRGASYHNTFQAIPADRLWRPALPDWPRISGSLPARVVSPDDNDPYAFIDEQGRYRVRLGFDLDRWSPGGDSRPVRLARAYAGARYGQHFPLHAGTEVQLSFVGGDPDRPYISGVMHDSRHPDPVCNDNATHNLLRTWGNNQLRMEDRKRQEHIQLATGFDSSQLNLGHLVDSQRQPRGEGFELRSDGWGAVRAGKGLLLSADARSGAGGQQRDMDEAMRQLRHANQLTEALSQAAQAAQAEPADLPAQRQLLDQTLQDLKAPGWLACAPAGMACTTAQTLQLSAGQTLAASAGRHFSLSALKTFALAAGDTISLFAQKAGVKLFANRGAVRIQAQNDAMELTAHNDLALKSNTGRLVLSAGEEVLLHAGGGYIRLKGGDIEIHCPGKLSLRGANQQTSGPDALGVGFNRMPSTRFDDAYEVRHPTSGQLMRNVHVEITRADGTVQQHLTSPGGTLALQKSDDLEIIALRILDETTEKGGRDE